MSDIQVEEVKVEGTTSKSLEKQFRVTVSADRVQVRVDQLIQERGKTFSERGFRPGKVPFERLKELFEGSALEKAISQIIQELTPTLLKEKNLISAFKPECTFETYDKEKGLTYLVSFETAPELPEISDKGLKLKRAALEISDAEIDTYIKEWAASHMDSKPLSKKRAAQKGDLVKVTMTLVPKGAKQPETNEMDCILTEEGLRPEILELLIGVKPGDQVIQEITLPKNTPNKKIAGKTVQATFDIHEIRERIPFNPDENFAKFLKLDSLKELQEQAKKALEQQGETLCFLWVKRQVLDFFAQKYVFEVPSKMVDLEYQSIWEQTYRTLNIPAKAPTNDTETLAQREAIFKEEVGKSEKELEEFYRKAANRRVRLSFVLTTYGKALNVQLTEQERQAVFWKELANYPGEEKAVAHFYRNNPQALNRMMAAAFEDKLLSHIADSHPSDSEEMSLEALQKLIEDERGF